MQPCIEALSTLGAASANERACVWNLEHTSATGAVARSWIARGLHSRQSGPRESRPGSAARSRHVGVQRAARAHCPTPFVTLPTVRWQSQLLHTEFLVGCPDGGGCRSISSNSRPLDVGAAIHVPLWLQHVTDACAAALASSGLVAEEICTQQCM